MCVQNAGRAVNGVSLLYVQYLSMSGIGILRQKGLLGAQLSACVRQKPSHAQCNFSFLRRRA